jgi:hypothetical protein
MSSIVLYKDPDPDLGSRIYAYLYNPDNSSSDFVISTKSLFLHQLTVRPIT